MANSHSVIIKGIQIIFEHLPKEINLKNDTVYIYQVINKYTLNYCINPDPNEIYFPGFKDLVSYIDSDMMVKNFSFLENINIHGTNDSKWLIAFGYYRTVNNLQPCILQYNGDKFYIVDPWTHEIIKDNIFSNQIVLIQAKNNELRSANFQLDKSNPKNIKSIS